MKPDKHSVRSNQSVKLVRPNMNQEILGRLNKTIDRNIIPLLTPLGLIVDENSAPISFAATFGPGDFDEEDLEPLYKQLQVAALFDDDRPSGVCLATDHDGVEHPKIALARMVSMFATGWVEPTQVAEDEEVQCRLVKFYDNLSVIQKFYDDGAILSFKETTACKLEALLNKHRLRLETPAEALKYRWRHDDEFCRTCIPTTIARHALLPLRALTAEMCDNPEVVLNIWEIIEFDWTSTDRTAIRQVVALCASLRDYIESWIEERTVPAARDRFEELACIEPRKRRNTSTTEDE